MELGEILDIGCSMFGPFQDVSSHFGPSLPPSLRPSLPSSIFYYGHPAVLYVNKFRVAGLLNDPINGHFESLFETGVDEVRSGSE